jgi:hypothetical protein
MDRTYPKEAVGPGTIVRSKNLDRLGIVTDAFYNDNKSIDYTCFFIPNTAEGMYYKNLLTKDLDLHGLMAEENEFDLIFYLMIGKVDLEKLDIFHVPGELVL